MITHDSTRKIKVVVLAPGLELRGGVSSFLQLVMHNAPDAVEITHIPTWSTGSGPRRFIYFAIACVRLFYLLLLRRIDIVHAHFAKKGSVWRKFFLSHMAFLFRCPVLLHAHSGAFPDFYQAQPNWLRRRMVRSVQKASRLIVLTERWKQYYCQTLGINAERVVVLPNPVELPALVPHRAGKKHINLVFVGKIDENKGALRVIQAVALLPPEIRERVRLIIAGEGDVELARRQAQSLNLPQVTVLGWIDSPQREEVLAGGDVFVLPSLREGLPMSILEALAWALPVISSPVGGIPEVVRDGFNGFLVPPADVAAIAQAMQRLIEDETLRLQMGMNARASVEHLDIHRYWQQLLGTYYAVLGVKEPQQGGV